MTVRSFAQNFEDVLLWRALKHLPTGRYVDIGAGHPTHHSVTRLFYDNGWSGLNVEPLRVLARALEQERERDVTVHAAVTSRDVDAIDLAVVVNWDELSTISEERAEELRSEGRMVATESVPAVRLDTLLARHGMSDVHFLKVDVEGAELDVLTSVDFSRTRPWIVLVEVLAGGVKSATQDDIRALLEGHEYRHAYFDGLNDFYVAAEHAERLLPSFATPVNITDDFVAVAESDQVIVDLIGAKLGMQPPIQGSEVVQRVDAVLNDRIAFETQSNQLTATVAEMETRIDEFSQPSEARTLGLKAEALEQVAFERERLIAWYAAEVSNHRARCHEQEKLLAECIANSTAQAQAREDMESQLQDVLSSTSWRTTLPIRALRRPRVYLKKMRQG